ncbi:hypothetical protein dsx2_0613 [Desulfovibrio sp. X2]|uniref:SiaB family protein kinase n=1 Tax=Desulfovibrio sp. X2 TaxID=941449 RepID=UPI000358B54D|nr:SiaB family protein kinase [Desulfovibrio sp. X2]EPR37681.1 hypothetical protein dsx2_0613 [Desulfovibrio sp. X2]
MDLFKIRDEFSRAGIMICFNGPFSHSIIDEIGQAVRNYLKAEDIAKAAVLDVFAIYIELAQNVKNYVARRQLPPEEASSCIITIAKKDGTYKITSGNAVLHGDLDALTESVDTINALEPPELRKRYRAQLRKETPEEALGAGLGLMEIAKRSSARMVYQITPMNGDYAFFSLTASV